MRYLSEDWFNAAARALVEAVDAPPADLVIEQRVDALIWRVELDATGARLHRDPADGEPAPDAVFQQSMATASSIAQGTTDAHQAFLLGDIRYDGDIDRLIEARDALGWLEAVLAPVMAATTFD